MKKAAIVLGFGLALALLGAFVFPLTQHPRMGSRQSSPERRLWYASLQERADMARAAWRRGDLDEAERAYREVYSNLSLDPYAYELGLLLAERGKNAEAKKYLHRVIRGLSTLAAEPTVLVQYAEVCQRTGDAKGASWALAKAGAKDWFEAYMVAAKNVQFEDHKLEAEFYQKALDIDPDDKAAKAGLAKALKDAAEQALRDAASAAP